MAQTPESWGTGGGAGGSLRTPGTWVRRRRMRAGAPAPIRRRAPPAAPASRAKAPSARASAPNTREPPGFVHSRVAADGNRHYIRFSFLKWRHWVRGHGVARLRPEAAAAHCRCTSTARTERCVDFSFFHTADMHAKHTVHIGVCSARLAGRLAAPMSRLEARCTIFIQGGCLAARRCQ